jgi:antitoxin ParD1/3/4
MNVSLAPELERFLNEQIRSGRYRSLEEAISKAVELLEETGAAESRIETLLQKAEDSGPATEMTVQDWMDIENEGLKMIRSRSSAWTQWLA